MATRMQQRRGTASQWTTANPVLAAGEIGFEIDTNKFKVGDGINQWGDLGYFLDETALDGSFDDYIPLTQKGAANGVATLDADGAIPVSQLGNLIADAPELLNTLEEISAALGDDPNFASKVVPIVKKTTTQWEADSSAIAAGTIAYDTTTSYFKIGNGTNAWSGTSFIWNGTQVATHVTNEINTLLGTSANFVGSVSLPTNTTLNGSNLAQQVSGLLSDVSTLETSAATVNDEIEAIQTDVANLQTGLSDAETAIEGLGTQVTNLSTSLGADITTLQDDLDTAEASLSSVIADFDLHDAKTTNVHGIADTSVLATQSQVSAAQTNAETTAATALTAHANDTTNIHGISDTAQLAYLNASSQTFTGSVEVDGNVVVDGNLTVNGTTFNASSTSIVIEDNLVQLAHQNAGNTVDLGLVVAYNDGAAKHSGIVRDVSDDRWKLFKGVTTEPTTTVNFSQGSLDDLQVAGLTATSVTATSATIGGVAFDAKADKTATINTMSGNHTAAIADVNNIREMSNGGTFSIPSDNAFWPVGQRVEVIQTGSSQVTIAGASGVTVNATPGLKLRAQWSGATIIKRAANTFVVLGDLAV